MNKDTGFSRKDQPRWCIVTAVFGRNVRVAGRSATRSDGVFIPAGVVPEFDKDGRVPRPGARISLETAQAARKAGPLPSPYLEQVLFYMNEEDA